MILQLNPPLPMICEKGKGLAHFLIDYGPEHNISWVLFLENGECWTLQNPAVRSCSNETFNRKPHEKDSVPLRNSRSNP